MFKNYLDVALRGFLANKLFSFINVFGLAVGLASAILIGLYVADELSYDRFHPNADRIYRIGRDIYPREDFAGLYMATVPPIAAEQLQQDYPEIEVTARVRPLSGLLARDDVAFYEDSILYADPTIADIIGFEWLAGDPTTALDAPTSIVLTESLARKYFGDEIALGQTLTYENAEDLTVTGVIRDLPHNTHLKADALRSIDVFLNLLPEQNRTQWGGNMMHTYVRLQPGADIAAMASTFPAFMDRHIPPTAGFGQSSSVSGISAMNIADIHLQSTLQNEMSAPGSMATVVALGTVAFGIVLIACFNFMNLSTARSVLRGKEVGIRKTIGAERKHLILQFMGESLGMALLATVIAIVLVEITLPAFNGFSGKTLAFDVLVNPRLQAALGLLVLGVGLVAGSYPALYLSAFKPAQVLKSRVSFGLRDVVFRNLLVVLQFSISIVLVIATVVVGMQMRYARALDLGFDKEQVVVLGGSPTQGMTTRWDALRQELLSHPEVVSVTASSLLPGMENLNDTFGRVQGAANTEGLVLRSMIVDYDFFATYKVDLLAGRAFSTDFSADRLPPEPGAGMTGNFILNASAAREFGWAPEEAIGQLFELGVAGAAGVKGSIVGVVADSNFETVRLTVKPLIYMLGQQGQWPYPVFSGGAVRITGNDLVGTLAYIDSAWQRVIPDFPLNRRFLSDDFEAMYQNDTRLGQLFTSFAGLAILIACLGLFGLATFNAQRRIKEIGVRKVMGGSVWSIVWLLTSNFSRLVLVSNLIAWPVAYFAMERWLENFAYRIDLTPLVFIGSGLIALCIAWVTVGGTAAKAASAKPVLALRYE
jgi:putative ABC transport system permease protein